MIEIELPDTEGVPDVVRAMAACIASVTEAPVSEVPQPAANLGGAIAAWRSWLAGSGAGLIALADPARFNWPGYWLAVLGDGDAPQPGSGTAVVMFGIPSGVVLSPQQPELLGTAATDLPVQEGYVIAGLDPAFVGAPRPLPRLTGEVAVIAITAQATGPMRQVGHARALAGRGLEGDRYAANAGTFTPADAIGRGYDSP